MSAPARSRIRTRQAQPEAGAPVNPPSGPLRGACHCGAVTITIASRPGEITLCNCSICRRLGALWAYYPAAQVSVSGHPESTESYIQGDRTLRTVRCRTCGCVTHWEPLAAMTPTARLGVNVRNFDPEQIGRVRMRLLDGADTWTSTFLDPPGARRPRVRKPAARKD